MSEEIKSEEPVVAKEPVLKDGLQAASDGEMIIESKSPEQRAKEMAGVVQKCADALRDKGCSFIISAISAEGATAKCYFGPAYVTAGMAVDILQVQKTMLQAKAAQEQQV